jgi:hypothetical protein
VGQPVPLRPRRAESGWQDPRIYGGFAIRRGDVDQGKMSILGGAIIAAAPAVVYAFYKIFGLDSNSAVGVGSFS